MSEQQEVQQVETPVVEQQVEAPVQKQRYEYQPTDDEGRPLGGPQVVEYADVKELADKMAHNHTEAIKLARKLKRDVAMGRAAEGEEAVPADMARVPHGTLEFKSRDLTPDEKWQITRGLSDPETFDEAADKLLEAKLGAKPEAIRQTLAQAQQDIAAMRAQREAEAFVQATPDYFVCRENYETLAGWMIKNDLQPTKTNFKFSYDRLKAAGLLLDAPIAASEDQSNSQTESDTDIRIDDQKTTPTKRPVATSSGLTKANSSSGGGGGVKRGYSEEEISKMSATEYREKVLGKLLRGSR